MTIGDFKIPGSPALLTDLPRLRRCWCWRACRKSAPIVGCLSAALFLAACGGGESEDHKIVSAIETSATTNDPSACTEFGTQNFNEQITGEEGEAAVEECEKSAVDEEENAESADVSNVEVDGSTATADVALTGGNLDGQTLAVSVIKRATSGRWTN